MKCNRSPTTPTLNSSATTWADSPARGPVHRRFPFEGPLELPIRLPRASWVGLIILALANSVPATNKHPYNQCT